MRGRPPTKTLSDAAARAASAFVDAAEALPSDDASAAASGAEAPATRAPRRAARPASNPGRRNQFGESDYPWNAPYVREDVVKGYALRLPEPLYLKLKWVAGQTGQSVNALCREAVEAEVERRLRDVGGG